MAMDKGEIKNPSDALGHRSFSQTFLWKQTINFFFGRPKQRFENDSANITNRK